MRIRPEPSRRIARRPPVVRATRLSIDVIATGTEFQGTYRGVLQRRSAHVDMFIGLGPPIPILSVPCTVDLDTMTITPTQTTHSSAGHIRPERTPTMTADGEAGLKRRCAQRLASGHRQQTEVFTDLPVSLEV